MDSQPRIGTLAKPFIQQALKEKLKGASKYSENFREISRTSLIIMCATEIKYIYSSPSYNKISAPLPCLGQLVPLGDGPAGVPLYLLPVRQGGALAVRPSQHQPPDHLQTSVLLLDDHLMDRKGIILQCIQQRFLSQLAVLSLRLIRL